MSNSVTPWTAAHQAPLSMGFSRQGYWSGLPCPPPGIFPTQGLNPSLLCLLGKAMAPHKEAKVRAEAQKMKDEAGRAPRSPAHPGKPQEQKQEKLQVRGAGTDCWTTSLPSRICLAGSETSMATLIASTPLRDTPSCIKTVPLGPLPWMDWLCSQLWPNVTCTMNCLFQTVLAEEEKNKTSPLGLCTHRDVFII